MLVEVIPGKSLCIAFEQTLCCADMAGMMLSN